MAVNEILVILMFITFIALLFTGYPIAWTLGGVGILFAFIGWLSDMYLGTVTGLDFQVVGMIVHRLYKLMSNWVMVAIPMFIYMGLMMDQSGIAEKMMLSMQNLLGRLRGGLAITVTVIGVILAASTGIVGASVTLLGILSLPAMLKQGYNKPLALGTIAASGTLGILIPPSVMLVVMADQLALSVGDLFMGAVFPGLILAGLYLSYIIVLGLVWPQAAPLPKDRPDLDWKAIWNVLKTTIPPAFLILAVLGSIFAGITTITEASGVGALGATLLAWRNKKLSFSVLKNVTESTMRMLGFVFGIFLGATCFSLVLRLLGGDEFVEKILTSLPFGPYGILIFTLGIIFLLGFFLDWIEISLIMLPLLAPVITTLGLDIPGQGIIDNPELVWFTVLVAVSLQTSFLTPPVGFSLFFLMGVSPPEVQLVDIYKGVIPFVILQLIALVFIIIWPELVIWLPTVAY